MPVVLAGSGAGWWASLLGVLAPVVAGLAMTAVMQSSTAAIALTLSAHYAGAVGLDQAYALIIGQNIGTATSFAMASRLAKTAGNDERQNFPTSYTIVNSEPDETRACNFSRALRIPMMLLLVVIRNIASSCRGLDGHLSTTHASNKQNR